MRIIGGVGKGRTLFSPPNTTRPTSDRAREALFSTLESEFGSIADLRVLDLFAGSGAVGVEAFSRGAKYVVCVEEREVTVNVIKKNFELVTNKVSVGSSAESKNLFHIYSLSVDKYLSSIHEAMPFDFIYLDPPYEFENAKIVEVLEKILAQDLLAPSGIIAVERSSRTPAFEWPTGFIGEKERKYGEAVIFYAGAAENI